MDRAKPVAWMIKAFGVIQRLCLREDVADEHVDRFLSNNPRSAASAEPLYGAEDVAARDVRIAELESAISGVSAALRFGPVHTDYRSWCRGLSDSLSVAVAGGNGGTGTTAAPAGLDEPQGVTLEGLAEIARKFDGGVVAVEVGSDVYRKLIEESGLPPRPPVTEGEKFYGVPVFVTAAKGVARVIVRRRLGDLEKE